MVAILAGLGVAGLFEVLTLVATQNKTVRAGSPWQDDPYDVVVSLALFAVPMLALAICLRLLAWHAPGAPDRERQTLRATGAMMALVGLTAVFEWAAVAVGAHAADRTSTTSWLIAGLAVVSVLTAGTTGMLIWLRRPSGSDHQWRHDWLGDVIVVTQWIPWVRQWGAPTAGWVRRHVITVFVGLSVLAAGGEIGALAVGEGWTDPLLITWALIIATTSNITFCVISNAVAGFIARPGRSEPQRITEISLLTGFIAIQITTAFRDAIWSLATGKPVTDVTTLAALTLGAGVLVSATTAAVLMARRGRVAGDGLHM